MGGRVVEGTSLENWRTFARTVGSNPTPSEQHATLHGIVFSSHFREAIPYRSIASDKIYAGSRVETHVFWQ